MKKTIFFTATLALMLCFSLNAFSFTAETEIKNPEEEIRIDISESVSGLMGVTPTRKPAELKPVSFQVNTTGLKEWHLKYSFIPYLYWPKLLLKDGSVTSKEPEASFRIFLQGTQLDCSSTFAVTTLHKAGKEQRCDLSQGKQKRSGIIQYRIDKIEGPSYKLSRKIAKWVFKVADFYKIAEENTTVKIDFSVRFRVDEGTGSGGQFTEWISSKKELAELLGVSEGEVEAGEGEVPSTAGKKCKPVIQKITYQGKEMEKPQTFTYKNYGDEFTVLVQLGEGCPVKDLFLGYWKETNLAQPPELKIDFLSWQIEKADQQGFISQHITLSEAPYPKKLFFAVKMVNSSGEKFYSQPVEFYFPGAEPGEGPGEVAPTELGGCTPCQSIVGCLACLDGLLVSEG